MARFAKGQSGNKNGRPKLAPELLEVKKMSPAYITAIINKYSHCNRAEIKTAIERAGTPMIECVIASIMVKAMSSGDYSRLDFLLNRAIGKVTDQVEVKTQHTVFSTTFSPEGTLVQQIMKAELEESTLEDVKED